MKNSQDNNGTPTLPPEFLSSFEKKLDDDLAASKAFLQEMSLANDGMKREIKTRCEKMKKAKAELKNSMKRADEKQKSLDSLNQSDKLLADYDLILKKELEKYRKENSELAEAREDRLEDMEARWKTFEAQYETRPFAVARSAERAAMTKENIELMTAKFKLDEMRKIVAKQAEINAKKRNNVVVECALLFKESTMEDLMMRQTLARQKRLTDELREEEAKIAELGDKPKVEFAVPQQSMFEKLTAKRALRFTTSQSRSQPSSSFDLSSFVAPLTLPLPNFRENDFDTISISSSVIDGLMELKKLPSAEDIEFGPGEPLTQRDDDRSSDAANLLHSNNTANNDEEDPRNQSESEKTPNPIATPQSKNPNNGGQAFEISETEFAVKKNVDPEDPQEYNSPEKADGDNIMAESDEVGEIADSDYPAPIGTANKDSGREVGSKSNPENQRELEEPELKRPRILNVEKVQLNFPNNERTPQKSSREDSLARYFAHSTGSSGDFNWKPNRLSSIFSDVDYQRDADLESIVGSEASMQAEDISKRFHTIFSPGCREKEEYAVGADDDSARRVVTQGTVNPVQISQSSHASPFLDTRNFVTPSSRGNKKDTFFLNMF